MIIQWLWLLQNSKFPFKVVYDGVEECVHAKQSFQKPLDIFSTIAKLLIVTFYDGNQWS